MKVSTGEHVKISKQVLLLQQIISNNCFIIGEIDWSYRYLYGILPSQNLFYHDHNRQELNLPYSCFIDIYQLHNLMFLRHHPVRIVCSCGRFDLWGKGVPLANYSFQNEHGWWPVYVGFLQMRIKLSTSLSPLIWYCLHGGRQWPFRQSAVSPT